MALTQPYHIPGPCKISYKAKELGWYVDGVIIRIRTEWTPITDQNHGNTPADFIFSGKAATVMVPTVDPAKANAADPWVAELLQQGTDNIGKLASALGGALSITERDNSVWGATYAAPIDPEELRLLSTQELRLPLAWLIIPDENGKLFTPPGYISGGTQ